MKTSKKYIDKACRFKKEPVREYICKNARVTDQDKVFYDF